MRSTDVLERLREAGSALPVPQPPVEGIVQKGRHRIAARLTALSAAVALAVAGLTWGTLALVRPPPPRMAFRPGAPPPVIRIEVGARVQDLVAGDDAVWGLGGTEPHATNVVRLDPATNQVQTFTLDLEPNTVATAMAVGEGGIWVTTLEVTNQETDPHPGVVLRIDPSTLAVSDRITVGRHPIGVAVGFGSVWVTNEEDDTLSRIDPATNGVTTTTRVGHCPEEVSVGEGSVWVTNACGNTSTSRVDPSTGNVTTIGVVRAVAADGWVWAEGPGKPNGGIVKIDPATNDIAGSFGLDIEPAFAAAGEGQVWIAKWFYDPDHTLAPGTLGTPPMLFRVFRIDPVTLQPLTDPVTVRGGPAQPIIAFGSLWVGGSPGTEVSRIELRGGN